MNVVASEPDFQDVGDIDPESLDYVEDEDGSIDYSKSSDAPNDIEHGDSNRFRSRSSSVGMAPEREFQFAEGINLINDCPYCYKPYGKLAANLSGSASALFIYVISMIPFVIRWTLHTSYIHFTESEPTLRKSFETKYYFTIGFFASGSLLAGEILDGIRIIYESVRGYQATPPVNYKVEEIDLYKGRAVLVRSQAGLPAWTTKNNKLAEKRPTSFRKWFFNLTFTEFVVHIVYSWRWLFGSGLFIGTNISVSALNFIPSAGINGSGFYLYLMHLTNGFAVPLFVVLGFKLIHMFASTQLKSMKYEYTGEFKEPTKMTKTGKIRSDSPFFIFLTDKCPCSYAVDKDSKLPTQYKYSIRYHCMLTGGFKYATLSLLTLYGLWIIAVSLFSLFTKPVLRTLMRSY